MTAANCNEDNACYALFFFDIVERLFVFQTMSGIKPFNISR